jgi:hypothetical protein
MPTMTEREIYQDMVKLAQDRCREAIVSVNQLVDEPEQQIALMINVAVDILGGVATYSRDRYPELSEARALYVAVASLCYGLGEETIKKGQQEAVAAWKREGKARR